MVSTRRTETVSQNRRSLPENRVKDSSGEESSEGASTDEEGERESESWSSQYTRWGQRRPNTGRVRELRNRFVCTNQQRDFTGRTTRTRLLSSCRNEEPVSMSHKRRRAHYSSRNGDDDSEDMVDSDFIFTPTKNCTRSSNVRNAERRHRLRSNEVSFQISKKHRLSRNGDVGERRSREGLRPLKRESYVDSPYSQETVTNSSDEKPDIEIRRSTRQRKFKYNTFNTSWITEHQMIRGYPVYKREFVSEHEDDSKESRDPQREQDGNEEILESSVKEISRKRNDTNSGCGLRKKYVYKYMTSRSVSKLNESQLNVNSNSTENVDIQEETLQEKPETLAKKDKNNDEDSGRKANNSTETVRENGEVVEEAERNDEEDEPRDPPIVRTNRRSKRNTMRYTSSPVRTRRSTRKMCDSDSTTEEQREHRSPKYTLRQRKPKPIIQITEHNDDGHSHRRLRRRAKPRRRRGNSSSDDSSSDSDSSKEPKRLGQPVAAGNNTMQLKPTRNRANTPPRDKGKPDKDLRIAPIDPEQIDPSITFAAIGGLEEQVRSLREMVVLPMLYPEIFKRFSMNPPKGVLFHGPPGTGKTLMAKALANECSVGRKKVSFFVRKGADLLSKWVGQTEKQMTMLFKQAADMAPSIIFFDELDGLAPTRAARQEQVHISVVASLLALMDGLDNFRGDVIVIGATNRPDAIDPALRRPGRFDREIYFPLPAAKQREEILKLFVYEWPEKPQPGLVRTIAERSVGYCGADLRALCNETVLRAVRRTYPQIYSSQHRLLIDTASIKVDKVDFETAAASLVPTGSRGAPLHVASSLPPTLKPLLQRPLELAQALIHATFPFAVADINGVRALQGGQNAIETGTAKLLVTGAGSQIVGTALLHAMEHVTVLSLDVAALHSVSVSSPEQACLQIFNEARRSAPSIVFMPRVELWWESIGENVTALLHQQAAFCISAVSSLPSVLILATTEVTNDELPESITAMFNGYRNEILHISNPTSQERDCFFRPLVVDAPMQTPTPEPSAPQVPPPLPRAPTPPPSPLSPAALQKLYEREEETLIELRIFLRDVCKKLARNKAFFMFTKPVNLEEVPDYLDIVTQPMDLETMMTKVDLHRYNSAQEFLADVDLIQNNALRYNPDVTPADKQIRHRACWFRDYAYALIKAEMDTDFEDNCRKIAKKRIERKTSDPYQFLPPHIRALAEEDKKEEKQANAPENNIDEQNNSENSVGNLDEQESKTPVTASPEPKSRKRRVPAWARGFLSSNKKRKKVKEDSPVEPEVVNVKQNTEPLVEKEKEKEEEKDTCKEVTEMVVEETDVGGGGGKPADIDSTELEECLAKAVDITKDCSVDILCDLYAQLNIIINKYEHSWERQLLPKEISEELDRFQKYYP